jgi:ABC-type Zn uptake system ZnuABC Zn-binding protein ZnuA
MLARADLVFSIGLALDENLVDELLVAGNRENLNTKLGGRIPERMLRRLQPNAAHGYGNSKYEPHVCLGIPQVIKILQLIRDELSRVDPRHADEYAKNATDYIARLKMLESYGKKILADKKNRCIVNYDQTLGYFAQTFGLEIDFRLGEVNGPVRNANSFSELVKLCLDEPNRIGAIVVPPGNLRTADGMEFKTALIESGVSTEVVEIDPLLTADPKQLVEEGTRWYETRMRRNLKALADVMK